MPYDGEFAQYRSIARITESERVTSLLSKCNVRLPEEIAEIDISTLQSQVKPSGWLPKWIIAIDGSKQEIPIKNGFPGAEVSYLTVASVMLNVEKMRQLDAIRPADPKEFRNIEQADSIDSAFPSCNIVLKNEISAKSSLRRTLFETLQTVRMSEDGESLLDTFEALLKYKTEKEQKCPYGDCQKPNQEYSKCLGAYECSCSLKRSLYSTDALRIHEGMNPAGTNGAMFEEIM